MFPACAGRNCWACIHCERHDVYDNDEPTGLQAAHCLIHEGMETWSDEAEMFEEWAKEERQRVEDEYNDWLTQMNEESCEATEENIYPLQPDNQ